MLTDRAAAARKTLRLPLMDDHLGGAVAAAGKLNFQGVGAAGTGLEGNLGTEMALCAVLAARIDYCFHHMPAGGERTHVQALRTAFLQRVVLRIGVTVPRQRCSIGCQSQ